MYTQCPACKTIFRLHLDQLNAAQGQVRCSRCHTVFHALDHLYQPPGSEQTSEESAPAQQQLSDTESLVEEATKTISAPETVEPLAEALPKEQPKVAEATELLDQTVDAQPTPGSEPSRPKNVTKRTRPASKERALLEQESSSPAGKQPAVETMKPATAIAQPSVIPPTEETLPLFGPEDDILSGRDIEPVQPTPVEQSTKASANTSDTPSSPLFEFNEPVEAPLFASDLDTGEVPGEKKSESKKGTPATPSPSEADLFDMDEFSEQDDSLLFHYLPEEGAPDGLVPDEGDLRDANQALPQASPQQKKVNRPGYTLPLEQESPRANLKGTLLWGLGIVLLLAGLGLQYLYLYRTDLAAEPRLRPLLAQMCQFTGCALPAQRDLARIELGKHLVQVHPRYTNSLLITATLINRADFEQPFPVVEVVMTDLEQKQVARRRFLPHEYLIGNHSERMLPPTTEVPLMLEVLDPGKNAVGFEFNFF